jgi:MoaA/NifB/PqqE/SkfB family radical SAM enzyme
MDSSAPAGSTGLASPALDRLILDSAVEGNILPITSRCGSGCVFCSHKSNPPDVAVHSVGVRSVDDVARTMAFLGPNRVITIGESATTIVEGEPFAHPDFVEIVSLVRRAYPRTPLEITTNGGYLTAETIAFLERIGNVALNVSLNSASTHGRRSLMGDGVKRAQRAIDGVGLLGRSTVRYSGSPISWAGTTSGRLCSFLPPTTPRR